jgi:hypothetical protein
MEQPYPPANDSWLDRFDAVDLLRWLLRPHVRLGFAWLAAIVASVIALLVAWYHCRHPTRADGNWGHVNVDFAGQWLLGRMVVEGYGRHLYDRNFQRTVAQDAYPVAGQDPAAGESDAEALLGYLIGRDDPSVRETKASFLTPLAARDALGATTLLAAGKHAWTNERLAEVVEPNVGGPLYPPVHALFCAPLALLPPLTAYRLMHFVNLLLAWVCGRLVWRLTDGRIWWPVAIVGVIVFPGFGAAINLGQNPALSLTILLAGWWQLQKERPIAAGAIWGLLAFKPVWAVSFFLVPLLTRRWQMAAAMLATGTTLAALTLPVVGWHSWHDWLKVGEKAAKEYTYVENWIILSRDLSGLPRRWLLDFDDGFATDRIGTLPTYLGWSLWATVAAATVGLAWRKRRQPAALDGAAAAFVLFGAWLACYRFMYYDVLLTGLPVCLLFSEPRRFLTHRVCDWVPLVLLVLLIVLPFVNFGLDPTGHGPPFETFCVLLLWLWCGCRWLNEPSFPVKALSLSGSAQPAPGDGQ